MIENLPRGEKILLIEENFSGEFESRLPCRRRRWDSICCGKQPLNILEVVGLRAPTAVAECHRHSAKSRPSLRMERALKSGRLDSFSAEKPRRLKHATGMFLRAAFRIPPSVKNKDHPDGWSLFWRRRWDSNPRGVLPPTRFRVRVAIRTLKENGGNSRTMREFANP